MPFLEVFLTQEQPPAREQKRAFAAELLEIVAEELGTKPASMRMLIRHVDPDDTLAVLDRPGAGPAEAGT